MRKSQKNLLSFATTLTLVAGFTLTSLAANVGFVTGSSVNLRKEANASSEVLGTIVKNSVVEVREQQNGWFKVSYNSQEGYMSSDYVTVVADGQALPQKVYGVVTAGTLNVRAAATTDSDIVAKLAADDTVEILTTSGAFYQVKTGSVTGYVHEDYLEVGSNAGVVNKGVVMSSGSLNVRSTASTSGEVVAKLPSGTAVGVITIGGAWHEVIYNGVTGFVSSDYLQVRNEMVSRNSFASGRAAYSSAGLSVIEYAKTLQGIPYRYGGSTTKGFDCSGFVKYVYAEFGVTLPRTSGSQYNAGTRVSRSSLQVGDIIAFGYSSVNHVGIYIGDGMFIHSPSPGKVVRIETLNSGYYNNYYIGACRVL